MARTIIVEKTVTLKIKSREQAALKFLVALGITRVEYEDEALDQINFLVKARQSKIIIAGMRMWANQVGSKMRADPQDPHDKHGGTTYSAISPDQKCAIHFDHTPAFKDWGEKFPEFGRLTLTNNFR